MNHMYHPSLTVISWTDQFYIPHSHSLFKNKYQMSSNSEEYCHNSLFMKVPSIWHDSNPPLLCHSPCTRATLHSQNPPHLFNTSLPSPARSTSWNPPGNCLVIKSYTFKGSQNWNGRGREDSTLLEHLNLDIKKPLYQLEATVQPTRISS